MDPRKLREATRAEHEATEALMPLMGPDTGPALYLAVLQTLYPLLRDWEGWAAGAADPELRGLLERRRRSQLLLADLAVFEARPKELDQPTIDWNAVVKVEEAQASGPEAFRASLLGSVYVMEGSTLGGRFIARHLEAALGLERGVGISYFQGHGEATGGMWREVLDQIAAVPDELATVTIATARRTFEAFGQVLRQGLPAAQTVQR